MIKSISARVLMVMACCVLGAMVVGCQGEMNPSSLTTDPNGDVDLTSLDNLHVEGTLEVNGVSETGPLNLLTLQLALLAQCYDEMVFDATLDAAQDTPVADVCMNGGLQHDFQNENGCHENVCAQQLYLCLGLKNQELAETVSPIEFSAKPFLPNEGDSYMNSDGSYRLQLIYDGNSQVYARHTYNHTYSIPPQSAPNRSLLHRAAVYCRARGGVKPPPSGGYFQ